MSTNKNDWAAGATRVAIKLITTGNVVWFVFLSIVLSIIWHMSSSDLRSCMISFIGWPWFGVTGWILFLSTLLLGKWVLKIQAQATRREMDRMAKVRTEAIQMRLELEMDSSKKK